MLTIDRDFRFALVGVSGLSILGYYIATFTPDTPVHIVIFFTIIAITVFGWTLFIIPSKRIAILTTILVIIFLLLRLFNLRHPLYAILLLTYFITQEYYRKKNP